MKSYEATEIAYKNGYEAGRRDAVKHGRWIETEEGTVCSECHKHPFEDGEFAVANYNGNFCPNCGADMRLSVVFDETLSAIKKPEFYLGGDNYET